jgi:hypothetical protein
MLEPPPNWRTRELKVNSLYWRFTAGFATFRSVSVWAAGGVAVLVFNLNSEIEQVVFVLLLVLEKSRYLSVTLMQRNGARRFGPCFDAQSQQIEHEHDHDF